MRLSNRAIDARGQSKIIRIHDQLSHAESVAARIVLGRFGYESEFDPAEAVQYSHLGLLFSSREEKSSAQRGG